MAHHEALWIADATIGPVVVLAQIVAVGRLILFREDVEANLPGAEKKITEEYQPLIDDADAHANPLRQGNLEWVMVSTGVDRIRGDVRGAVRRSRRLARLAYMAVALSLASVAVAVSSLAWERDVVGTTVMADVIAATLVALLWTTVSEVRLRLRLRSVGLSIPTESP